MKQKDFPVVNPNTKQIVMLTFDVPENMEDCLKLGFSTEQEVVYEAWQNRLYRKWLPALREKMRQARK